MTTSVEDLISDLKAHNTQVAKVHTESFSKLPSEVEIQFAKIISAESSHSEFKKLKSKVLDLATLTNDKVSTVKLGVSLLVPRVEDGGNFGVAIQMSLLKQLGEYSKDLVKVFDDVTSYYEKRLSIVEKFAGKVAIEEKENKLTESVEKDKIGTSRTETITKTKGEITVEHVEALCALDLKLYIQLKQSLKLQIEVLATVADFLEKNKEKIKAPRTTGSSYTY